jgi:hypothetical protein
MKIFTGVALLVTFAVTVDGNAAKQNKGTHPDDCKIVKATYAAAANLCCCGPADDFYEILEDGETLCKSVNYVFDYEKPFDFTKAETSGTIELISTC